MASRTVPRLDMDSNERLKAIPGTPPDLLNPPKGDPFAPRSDYAMVIDYEKEPPVTDLGNNHYVIYLDDIVRYHLSYIFEGLGYDIDD